jgi:hypothetical protein
VFGDVPGFRAGDARVGRDNPDRLAIGEQVAIAVTDLAPATFPFDDEFTIGRGLGAELLVSQNVELNEATRQCGERER